MPRHSSIESRVRLNLEIGKSVRDRLEKLQSHTRADSITEVIRRALVVYEALLILSKDSKLVLRRSDGSEADIIVIP